MHAGMLQQPNPRVATLPPSLPLSVVYRSLLPLPGVDDEEDAEPFNWQRARLRDCGLSAAPKAKLMTNLIISQTLVPLVSQGKSKMAVVLSMCSQLLDRLVVPAQTSTLMEAAIQEVLLVARFLRQLVQTSDPKVDMDSLNQIMNAKSGTKYLVRQCVLQSGCYREAETMVRQTELASRTMGPKVEAAIESLSSEPTWSQLHDIFTQLPRWDDSLRKGQIAACFSRLKKKAALGDGLPHAVALGISKSPVDRAEPQEDTATLRWQKLFVRDLSS